MIKLIQFERGGYFFWLDIDGRWGVSKDRTDPPTHCAYGSAEVIAYMKGIRL